MTQLCKIKLSSYRHTSRPMNSTEIFPVLSTCNLPEGGLHVLTLSHPIMSSANDAGSCDTKKVPQSVLSNPNTNYMTVQGTIHTIDDAIYHLKGMDSVVINKMAYTSYFLVAASLPKHAREQYEQNHNTAMGLIADALRQISNTNC